MVDEEERDDEAEDAGQHVGGADEKGRLVGNV